MLTWQNRAQRLSDSEKINSKTRSLPDNDNESNNIFDNKSNESESENDDNESESSEFTIPEHPIGYKGKGDYSGNRTAIGEYAQSHSTKGSKQNSLNAYSSKSHSKEMRNVALDETFKKGYSKGYNMGYGKGFADGKAYVEDWRKGFGGENMIGKGFHWPLHPCPACDPWWDF